MCDKKEEFRKRSIWRARLAVATVELRNVERLNESEIRGENFVFVSQGRRNETAQQRLCHSFSCNLCSLCSHIMNRHLFTSNSNPKTSRNELEMFQTLLLFWSNSALGKKTDWFCPLNNCQHTVCRCLVKVNSTESKHHR